MNDKDKERRRRRIHFWIFDLLSTIIVIGLLALSAKLFVKALDYECNQYEIAKANVAEQRAEKRHEYVIRAEKRAVVANHRPMFYEFKLIEEPVVEKQVVKEEKKADDGYLGRFRITHYCDCEICQGSFVGTTATGATPTVGRTIAVDRNVIPLGSKVVIDGHTYVAEDTGGAIRGNRIDIFVGSHEEANRKGVYYAEVYRG